MRKRQKDRYDSRKNSFISISAEHWTAINFIIKNINAISCCSMIAPDTFWYLWQFKWFFSTEYFFFFLIILFIIEFVTTECKIYVFASHEDKFVNTKSDEKKKKGRKELLFFHINLWTPSWLIVFG